MALLFGDKAVSSKILYVNMFNAEFRYIIYNP